MGKSFNPKRQLICSLCGWGYIEKQGRPYSDCAGRIMQLQLELGRRRMRDLEQKYKEASRRAQQEAEKKSH